MKSRFLCFAGLMLATMAGQVEAAFVTFDDLANTGNAIQTSISSGGFDFNGGHFHIIDSVNPDVVRNGSSYLAAESAQNLGQAVTMTKSGGGAFTLFQLDVAELWLPGSSLNDFAKIRLTGTLSGGGTVSYLHTLDGVRDGAGGVADFETITLGGSWTNLASVTITGENSQGAFGDYSFDNLLVATTSVPEPASIAMWGLGAIGLMFARRKRKQLLAAA